MKEFNQEMPHSPVQPIELGLDDSIQFQCRKGIACFNRCCESIEITLTPYDIIRLKTRLKLMSKEFVSIYTVPFQMDGQGMPGLKLITKPGTTACTFLTPEGCGVYEDRPTACRYYALGNMGLHKKDSTTVEDIYFLVKEDHCLGHNEPCTITIRDYRKEQGVEKYDEMNREWRELVLKKRSAGPTVGAPSPRSMQLFDMCSYDLDSFRDFIQAEGFRSMFDIEDTALAQLVKDDDALFAFAIRFLRQVLFGEHSIPFKQGARERRIAERKEDWEKRRKLEIERFREQDQFSEDGPG